MSETSWASTRRLVYERAGGYCEYCRTFELSIGQAMHVDHIDPNAGNNPDNLCLACPSCNLSKGASITGIDPAGGGSSRLFNPRLDNWGDHFQWVGGGLLIQGMTPAGRATVERLKMNRPRIIRARQNWIIAGVHPPV